MIARKTEEGILKGSVIRAMFTEGKAMAERYGAENVYDYSLGNPAVPAPEKLKSVIADLVKEADPLELHGYMNNAGFPEVRDRIAEDLNRRFGTSYDGAHIVMTVGAAGGLNVALKTILDPGDEVIVFAPYFGEYKNYVANWDGALVEVSPDLFAFQPNLTELEEKITPRTKAVIINTPNNPTGVLYSEETLKRLGETLTKAGERIGHAICLLSDEPYRELVYDGAQQSFPAKHYKHTIVCYSFSKSLSLPGERIGYLAVSPEIEDEDRLLEGLTQSNRVLGFVNAPSLMQKAVAACLSEKTELAFYDKNRKRLYESLTACGFFCVKPEGAFYLWMKVPGAPEGKTVTAEEEQAFVDRAKEERLLLVKGSAFGCTGYVRIAYCVSPEMIERSLASFRQLAKHTVN
ncbi:MAG: pyridoxal phosphate-dependent aminotransferase [Lachnospiraceae bacterium]|nr:pyridoxal phosphate-dependent aminotransferase [Lachnospiraceae bacterium]